MVGNPCMVGSPYTWWGAHIHSGLASFGGVRLGCQGCARGPGTRPPGPPPKLAKPPCMWAPHHAWVPHHVFGLLTTYLGSPPCIFIKGIRYQVTKFWTEFGSTLDQAELTLDRFGVSLGSVRDQFGIGLGSVWNRLGSALK